MHDTQKVGSNLWSAEIPNAPVQSKLSKEQLEVIFVRHASLSLSPASSSASEHTSPPTPQPTATELTLDAFSNFLLSPDNAPFSELTTEIWQDMTQPISSYYISSSHNTYLVGHQLVGVSTVEGYIRALLHSCRSVECTCLCPVFSVF
jgi:phosphatidylinositol phospholipase C delta